MVRKVSERSRRKRDAILNAATELFLTRGYAGTSMDDVAAAAQASKQTVYKNFGDKETLFRDIAMSTVTGVSEPFQAMIGEVEDADDVPAALRHLARRYITAVMTPGVLRRRQLVVRESGRFPDLARAYHDGAPLQTIGHLAATFTRLGERGELSIDDPETAATHFAFLILGRPLDTVMFRGLEALPAESELIAIADTATDVFLRAYGPRSG